MSNSNESEMVNRPKHYNYGKIEAISVIDDWKLNFNLGSVVKYVCRAGKKDPTKLIEDLEKAMFYLEHEIKSLKVLKEKNT